MARVVEAREEAATVVAERAVVDRAAARVESGMVVMMEARGPRSPSRVSAA